jgi:hypothetical protein
MVVKLKDYLYGAVANYHVYKQKTNQLIPVTQSCHPPEREFTIPSQRVAQTVKWSPCDITNFGFIHQQRFL